MIGLLLSNVFLQREATIKSNLIDGLYNQLLEKVNEQMKQLQKKVQEQKNAEEQERLRKIQEEMEKEKRRKEEEEQRLREEEENRKKKAEIEARRKKEEEERKKQVNTATTINTQLQLTYCWVRKKKTEKQHWNYRHKRSVRHKRNAVIRNN